MKCVCTLSVSNPGYIGLAGIGDLMLTAFGDLSRNRSCGKRIAQGESVGDITAAMTVEGVYSAKVKIAIVKGDDT